MPFNGVLLVSVAKTSAEVWQFLSCLPDPIESEQLLDLVICFPLQQLGRLALCVWTFLCVPPDPYYYRRYSYNSSASSSSSSFYDDEDLVGASPPVAAPQYYYDSSSSSSHSD
ncbi:uncharacterized protein [Nicotiana tomentosiformis]|uniref:uncharacterized protein n=1 Tax=Nicotiana tomentosiformis TaxID=4098 RepID=UPI000878A392|nr:uncharacterized protein LOC104096559 [Nicotiana tomentosiformis]XP_033512178.1 uncharacterized protein LOC104096559 [Nicotiana tomentosiformis]